LEWVFKTRLKNLGWLGRGLFAHNDRTSRVAWLNRISGDILRSGKSQGVARVLGVYAGVIAEKPEQLATYLLGRLKTHPFHGDSRTSFHPGRSWLRPLYASFGEPSSGLLRAIRGHEGTVYALLRIGSWLVSGSGDGTIKVCDLGNSSAESITLSRHTKKVFSLASHEDTLVSGSFDGTVLVWDWADLSMEPVAIEVGSEVWSVAISENYVAAGDIDGTIRLWDRDDLNSSRFSTFKGHEAAVTDVILSGSQLISCSRDSTIHCRDLNRSEIEPYVLDDHTGQVLKLSIDGRNLISCSSDASLCVWNHDSLSFKPVVLRGHTGVVWDVATFDGVIVSACYGDDTLRVWDLDNLEADPVTIEMNDPTSVCLKDNVLATGHYDGSIKIWDFEQIIVEMKTSKASPGYVVDLDVEGDLVVSCARDDSGISLWSATKAASNVRKLWGPGGAVRCVCFHDGIIACGSDDGTVYVWEVDHLESKPRALDCNGEKIKSICALGSSRIAAGFESGIVSIWNLVDSQLEAPICFGTDSVLALSGFKNTLAVAAEKGVRVLELVDREREFSDPAEAKSNPTSVAISELFIASGSTEMNQVQVWNADAFMDSPMVLQLVHYTCALEIVGTCVVVADLHAVRIFDIRFPDAVPLTIYGGSGTPILAIASFEELVVCGSEDKIESCDRSKRSMKHLCGSVSRKCWDVASTSEIVAAAFQDGTVRAWSTHGDTFADSRIVSTHRSGANRVRIFQQKVISCSDDGTIHVGDFSQLDRPPVVLNAHQEAVEALAFDYENEVLYSGSTDHTIRIWSIARLEEDPDVIMMDAGVLSLEVNSEWLVAGLEYNRICVWRREKMNAPTFLPNISDIARRRSPCRLRHRCTSGLHLPSSIGDRPC